MILRFAKLAFGSLVLSNLLLAQTPADPTSSSIVSLSTNGQPGDNAPAEGIKPDTSQPAEDSSSISVDPASLLPDLPAVPKTNATLVGGTIARLDRVRDQLTVRVFGGGQVKALFDPRTQVYRGSREVTIADLQQGERVYLDTILDGDTIFARSIRLSPTTASGQSEGIVLRYRPDRGELTIRDGITPMPVQVAVDPSTKYSQGGRQVSAQLLVPGALVRVSFDSRGSGHGVAREIIILALPGTHYTFTGQVVHIDLRQGLLVINSATDHKTYEIYLNPEMTPDDNLQPGAMVTVEANFQDSRYVAGNIAINSQGR